MAYYIQILNKAFGPFDTEQLSEMKDNGKISRATFISENKIDWIAAENLEFLFPTSQQPEQQIQATSPTSFVTSSTPEPAIWFYSHNGIDGFGPVTVSAITQMIKSGTLNAQSVAWQEGQFAKKLNELSPFAEYFGTKNTSPVTDLLCSACGSQLVPSSNFCPSCGLDVKSQWQNINPSQTDSTGIGYTDVLKKYADFNGRARRREYWCFTIINQIILPLLLISLGIIIIFVMTTLNTSDKVKIGVLIFLSAIYLLYSLLIFLPSLAVCVRRLHDTGNSGWMILMMLIPVIGWIILLIFLIQDSQPGTNQYGLNPKFS
ncbi:MAG: DUF805 domain-containing protein [Planctomycetaceae bacterium]|jgi:uncharacterized membrane protein YhaH (DUF805 family)|nr:DUF805 domain-containing protein [Planctomycetaceae bacterium]